MHPSPGAPDPEPLVPRRRRVPTGALVGAAVLLGLLGGLVGGYTVQFGRRPSPLPPLAGDRAAYHYSRTATSAADAQRLPSDGDLRTLLLPLPPGATKADDGVDGFLTPAQFASHFRRPGAVMTGLAQDEYRRGATVTWRDDAHVVEIELVQYRDLDAAEAHDEAKSFQAGERNSALVTDGSVPLPGTATGAVFFVGADHRQANVLARRGDIVMDMWIASGETLSESYVLALGEKQWRRL
ncbi:hypothetical protein BIV57_04765 [Mangrovactinospora gilvigrisea]|uniref:Uncharacterized protein n=1 Tax=Mangrovactinospora gilvigrisea TaxID=1428644 RepID=A0A1J7BIS3_9ACTN|nr:hypothetical protein [Mangrovactinospora gilvigrisea]OIV38571.1 hypothetical protein BIV57_04765 [Mangrovactinospora gilvigrisea]